jgi:hypothetical protein
MYETHTSQANERSANHKSACSSDPVNMAQREFLTFINTVTELFGSEPSRFFAEVWLNELALMDNSAGLKNCEWRLVTVAALARLAIRLTGALQCPNATGDENLRGTTDYVILISQPGPDKQSDGWIHLA